MTASVVLQSQTWDLLVERVRGLFTTGSWLVLDWMLAILVVLSGWVIARLLEAVTLRLLRGLRFNEGIRRLVATGGDPLPHEPAAFASAAVRWTVVVVSLLLALDALGLNVTTGVSDRLVDTLPRVVTATIMLAAGLVVAWILGGAAHRLFRDAGLRASRARGQVVTAVLSGFAVLLSLEQLGFAAQFVMALGITAVGALGLAAGLAFGLGCRDLARDFVVEYLRSLDKDRPAPPREP